MKDSDTQKFKGWLYVPRINMNFLANSKYLVGSALMSLFVAPSAMGAGGSCANYIPTDCSPSCGSSCSYYDFSSGSITQTISKIPYNLMSFIPSGDYCDLPGEERIFAAPLMKKIPLQVGDDTVKRLPSTVTLTYKIPQQRSKSGGLCPASGCVETDDSQEACVWNDESGGWQGGNTGTPSRKQDPGTTHGNSGGR